MKFKMLFFILIFLAAPAFASQIDQTSIVQLTRSLESGNGAPLESFLKTLCLDERINVLKQVEDRNKKNRDTTPGTAEVLIRISTTKVGSVVLTIERKLNTIGDWFAGGKTIYQETTDLRNLHRKVFTWKDTRN